MDLKARVRIQKILIHCQYKSDSKLKKKTTHNLCVFSIHISTEPQPSHVAVSAIKSFKQHQGSKPGNTENHLNGPSLLALSYHLSYLNNIHETKFLPSYFHDEYKPYSAASSNIVRSARSALTHTIILIPGRCVIEFASRPLMARCCVLIANHRGRTQKQSLYICVCVCVFLSTWHIFT